MVSGGRSRVSVIGPGSRGVPGRRAGAARRRVQDSAKADHDAAPFLAQLQHVPAVFSDLLDRFAQLRPAVASLGAEHVTGEAFTVQAHQR